jgi:hypothetical protein
MNGLGADRYREIVRFLTPWFRDLQEKMNLGGWHIEFIENLDRLPDEQGSGGIYRFIGQRSAEIYLGEWALGTHSPYELKLTVLHEMVHCHTQPMWEEHRHLSRQLGELIWSLLGPAYAAHEENIADGLANVIGPLLPDPPDWRHLLSPTMEITEYSQEGLTTTDQDDGGGEIKPMGIVTEIQEAAKAMLDPDGDGKPDYAWGKGVVEIPPAIAAEDVADTYAEMPAETPEEDSPRTKKRRA